MGLDQPRTTRTITPPTTERSSPAGWKGAPGAGLEKSRASSPPTIDPAMPSSEVARKPMWSSPG